PHAHPDLHWFPTRRSSDLVEAREKALEKQLAEAERNRAESAALLEEHKKLIATARTQAHAVLAESKALAEKERAVALEKTRQERSEEHTSELQSLRHLVCR